MIPKNQTWYDDKSGESARDFAPPVFTCSICGEKYLCDSVGEFDFYGESVCQYCAKDEFDRCQNCGLLFEKGKYKSCPECGEIKEFGEIK